MGASVNNIAATFASLSIQSSSSSSSNTATFPLSAFWNRHRSLPSSLKSTFVNLYGGAGPAPAPALSFPGITVGGNLPDVTLRYQGPNGKVRRVAASRLAEGRNLLLVGVSAVFSTKCSRYVLERIDQARKGEGQGESPDPIACVGVYDECVMKAWGREIGVGEKARVFSDRDGKLATALGLSPIPNDCSCFCLAAVDGVITTVDFDDSGD